MLQLLFAMRLGWTPLNGRLAGFPPRGVTGLFLIDALITWDWTAFAAALAHLELPAASLPFPAPADPVRFISSGVQAGMKPYFLALSRAMGLTRSLSLL